MSAEAVKSEILEPMQRVFYPPKQNMPANDQAAALRNYVSVLQAFDTADLRAAWTEVCATYSKGAWPLPAVFVAAARNARQNRIPAPAGGARRNTDKISGTERWERWKAVSRTQMARDACMKGVAWPLKCAVLDDGKRAEEIDLRALAIAKSRAESTAALIRRGEPVPHFRAGRPDVLFSERNAKLALDLWDRILVREAETQAEINYGVAA